MQIRQGRKWHSVDRSDEESFQFIFEYVQCGRITASIWQKFVYVVWRQAASTPHPDNLYILAQIRKTGLYLSLIHISEPTRPY